jgi:hypothetical protein
MFLLGTYSSALFDAAVAPKHNTLIPMHGNTFRRAKR